MTSNTTISGVTSDGMTLIVAVKGQEGITLAADSRGTLNPPEEAAPVQFSDNATKLFRLGEQSHIGVLTAGTGALGEDRRSIAGYFPEFEESLSSNLGGRRSTVDEIARYLGTFYRDRWEDAGMSIPKPPDLDSIIFLVAGFNEGEPYGRLYEIRVPDELVPHEYFGGDAIGLITRGQDYALKRIIRGFDDDMRGIAERVDANRFSELSQRWEEAGMLLQPTPATLIYLQSGVDFCRFAIRVTSVIQDYTVGRIHGVGGAVDVATVTCAEGFRYITKKEIIQRQVLDELDRDLYKNLQEADSPHHLHGCRRRAMPTPGRSENCI